MLSLSYTAEKEGNFVSVNDRLMLNEWSINYLMETLVANGYTIEEMSVADATLQEMKGNKEMLNAITKVECNECNGAGFIFWGDEDNYDVETCECVA